MRAKADLRAAAVDPSTDPPNPFLLPFTPFPTRGPMDWKAYDPTWLVDWLRAERPDLGWLADALARCTRAAENGRAYLAFVDPAAPNAPGSAWQFAENLVLDHPREGTLVLDILTDRRIGGMEFLSRL